MIPSSYARVATGKPCCIAAAARNCRKKVPNCERSIYVPARHGNASDGLSIQMVSRGTSHAYEGTKPYQIVFVRGIVIFHRTLHTTQ